MDDDRSMAADSHSTAAIRHSRAGKLALVAAFALLALAPATDASVGVGSGAGAVTLKVDAKGNAEIVSGGKTVLVPAKGNVLPGGKLLVNEIAPRVHNSGHWTEAVAITDQFEQHIRAVVNWPLGDPNRMADVVMENLIGDEIAAIPERLGNGLRPHSYGKAESRKGRKMGHINRVALKKRAK